jgi:predicted NodU family carbamoyl transferase
VHEDGTSRAQVLQREFNPRYYDLMVELDKLTGNGVVLNTSLNRRDRTSWKSVHHHRLMQFLPETSE